MVSFNSNANWLSDIKKAGNNLMGPSTDEVDFRYSFENNPIIKGDTSAYASSDVLVRVVAIFKNNSEYYISYIELTCDLFDSSNNRLKKGQAFPFSLDSEISPGNALKASAAKRGIWGASPKKSRCEITDVKGTK
jgi:hypothetical protein